MEIQTTQQGQVTVIAARGSIDAMTASNLTEAFNAQVNEGRIRLVADLSGIQYMSSAGLRALLATLKDARAKGGDLRLAGVKPSVMKVLDLSGFTTIMKHYGDTATAVASYNG